jgi:hypothetical protein
VAESEDDIIPDVDVEETISPEDTVLRAEEEVAPAEVEETAVEETKVEETKAPVSAFDEDLEPKRSLPILEIGVAIGVPVACLAIAFLGYINFSTALYIIGVALVALMMWVGRKTNTIYTVILGIVLIALLTSIYFLWTVLAKLGFDVKAQEAKQRVTMAQPLDRNVMRT